MIYNGYKFRSIFRPLFLEFKVKLYNHLHINMGRGLYNRLNLKMGSCRVQYKQNFEVAYPL